MDKGRKYSRNFASLKKKNPFLVNLGTALWLLEFSFYTQSYQTLLIKLSLKKEKEKKEKKKGQAASLPEAVLFDISFATVPKVTYSFALPASVLPVPWCCPCLVRFCAAVKCWCFW